jgi:ankyrin repeat protein
VKRLLSDGADVNFQGGEKCIPLHHAAKAGDLDSAKFLIEYGAMTTATDVNGYTPLHFVCSQKQTGANDKGQFHLVAQQLIEAGAPFEAMTSRKTGFGQTPLHIACQLGGPRAQEGPRAETIGMLLTFGAKLNSTDDRGVTPLHLLAACTDSMDSIPALQSVVKKAIYCENDRGLTPLHYAVMYQREGSVKFLLKNDAAVHQKDSKGLTALHYACMFKEGRLSGLEVSLGIHITELLGAAGADIEARDNRGYSPLHVALEQVISHGKVFMAFSISVFGPEQSLLQPELRPESLSMTLNQPEPARGVLFQPVKNRVLFPCPSIIFLCKCLLS